MAENYYTLTFNLDGGTGSFPDITGEEGFGFNLPSEIPVKIGYTFVCWQNSIGDIYYPNQLYSMVYGNDTLIAVWELLTFTLSFETNGSSDTFAPIVGYPGQTIDLPVPLRDGFSFSRWAGSNGTSYVSSDSYTFGYSNETLSAIWSSTLTFDLDGGTGDFPDVSGEEMTSILLPDTTPTKEGFHFVKWVSKYGDMLPGAPYFFTGNDTVTAVWEVASYTLTYDTGVEGQTIPSQEGQATTNIILSDTVPVRDGYTFIRWESLSGEAFQPGDPYFFGYSDETLTAVWGYTVTVNYGDGTTETVKGAVGETFDFIPENDNYVFVKWVNSAGSVFTRDNVYTFSYGDDCITAMWGYSVTYDTKDGNESFPTQYLLQGEEFTLPATTPTKGGFAFVQWTTEPEDPRSGTAYHPGDTLTCCENTLFYAVWVSGVSFDANGGSCESMLYTGFDNEVCTLPTATREGYSLVKWVSSQGVEFEPGAEYPFSNGDDTLTAVWGYTVTLNANGGECETTVTKAVGDTLDVVPAKDGLNFIKWTNSAGLVFDASNPYTFTHGQDTLTATWGYTVTYLEADGSVFNTQNALEGESVTVIEDTPSRDSYEFVFWISDNRIDRYSFGDTLSPNRNITLKPVWTRVYTVLYFDGTVRHGRAEKLSGESITVQDKGLTKEGQTFVCWKVYGRNEYYYPGEEYTKDEDNELHAVWVNDNECSVLYDTNGAEGDFEPQTVETGGEVTIPSTVPVKQGYLFNGWVKVPVPENVQSTYSMRRTASEDSQDLYDPLDTFAVSETVVLRASMDKGVQITSRPNNDISYLNEISHQLRCFLHDSMQNSDIQWTSSNFKVASVTANGLVNLKTPGQTTITVTATYTNSAGVTSVYEDSFVLTVFLDSTNSISFKIANRPLNDSIAYGYTATLEIESDFHTEYINWESQNGAVATISSNGVITAVQNGSTVITATVTVNNNNYTDSFVLTVKDSIFEDNDKFDDEDVKSKALDKMNWYYYNNKEEIQGVVNGTDSDCDTCIFAFEGLGEGFGGITEENQISAPYSYHKLPYNFLNAMMVVTKGNKIEYVTRRASTLPDNRPNNYPGEGITTMHSGVYEYKQGWHGGYAALVPIYPVYPDGFGKPNKLPGWYKDTNDNFYSDGCAGTNIHASGLNPAIGELANSEGCQLVYTSDYFDFGVQVGFLNSYPDDSAPTSSISDNMPIIIGKNSSFVNKDSDIKVKYILNRDYDEKNKTYQNNPSSDCNNGIFYPINHEICHEKCIFCK